MKRRTKKLVAALMLILILLNNSLNVYASIDSIEISEDVSTSIQEDVSNETAAPVQEPSVPTEEPPAQEPQTVEEAPVGGEQATIQTEEVEPTSEVVAPETNTNENDSEVVTPEPEAVQDDNTQEAAEPVVNDETVDVNQNELAVEDDIKVVEPEEDLATLMPAQDFKETVGNIHVSVHADKETFYKGTYMKVEPVETSNIIDSLEETISESVASVVAVNITFYNENNEEVEPQKEVSVSITSDVINEMKDSVIVHVDDNGETALVNKASEANNNVSFDTKEFSIYAVVGTETISTLYNASNGNTYEVTVTYGPEAKIPYGSKLQVTEFADNSNEYANARKAVLADKKARGEEIDYSSLGLSALDISILDKDGIEIEPEAPVKVDLKIKALPGVNDLSEVSDSIGIQHHVETENGIIVDRVNYNNSTNPDSVTSIFDVKTNESVISTGMVVDPNSIHEEDFNNENQIDTSFEVGEFSTFTITWNRTNTAKVHYVDESGNELTVVNGRENDSNTSPAFLIYDIEGYEYVKTTIESVGGTQIAPLLRLNSNKWQYTTNMSNNSVTWQDLSNNDDIYVVYKTATQPVNGGTPIPKETGKEPNNPSIHKVSVDNRDATRTLSLNIIGDTEPLEVDKLADVIVVLDVSSSMNNYSRLTNAKNAIYSLADKLIGDNTKFKNRLGDKLIRMSLITFSSGAQSVQGFTSDYTTYHNTVAGLSTSTGTNWEAALRLANQTAVESDRATFVIFVTDGNPSYRTTRGNLFQYSDYPNYNYTGDKLYPSTVSDGELDIRPNDTYSMYRTRNIFGSLAEKDERNFNTTLGVVQSIVDHNKYFYSIGIGTESGISRLKTLTKVAYRDDAKGEARTVIADNAAGLESAFQMVVDSISALKGWGNIDMVDGITDLSNTVMETKALWGVDNDFVYYKIAVPENWASMTDEQKSAYIESNQISSNVWNPSSENCNPASYESGAVTWHMGTQFIPQKGYIYSVSFRVWPSQEAYDTLARCQNDPSEYDNLSQEVKNQIIRTGTAPNYSYTLKTNTENAHTTYKSAVKSGDNIQIKGDEQTLTFNKVPNLNLASETIRIKKEWHNELDDREGRGSYLFDVTGDGTKFCDVTLSENTTPPWEKNDIHISAGLMTVVNGVTTVYEKGHDYTVVEPSNLAYYWDFTADIYHPMVINNQTKMLIRVNTANEAQYTIDYGTNGEHDYHYYKEAESNALLTAKNYRRSFLDLSKTILDESGAAFSDDTFQKFKDEEFTFEVTITDSTGGDVWFSVFDENDNLIKDNYAIVNGTATPEIKNNAHTGYFSAHSGTKLTLTLKPKWNCRFINLPIDSHYVITEKLDSTGIWKLNSIVPTVQNSEGDVGTQATVTGMNAEGNIDKPNNEYAVEYKNQIKAGLTTEATVKKVWNDGNNIDRLRPGNLTVSLSNGEQVTLSDSNRWEATISNLPMFSNGELVTYTWSESVLPEGYTLTDTSVNGTITTLTNTHVPVASIKVTKNTTVNGQNSTSSITNGTYNFVVKNSDEETIANISMTFENGVAVSAVVDGNQVTPVNNTVEITNLDAGTYTVSESTPNNGTTLSSNNDVSVTAESGKTGDNVASTGIATFTNNINIGNINVSKVVTGTTANDKDFTITITLTPPRNVNLDSSYPAKLGETDTTVTVSNNTITFTLKANETIKILNLPEGTTYVARESNVPTGYAQGQHTGVSGSISKDTEANVVINNTYSATGNASLAARKVLTGKALENGQFTFVLKEENNELQRKTNDANGNISFDTISYTQADLSRSPIKYKILEVIPDNTSGYTFDQKEVEVTVTLVDDGEGHITATPVYSQEAVFNNAYNSSGNIVLEVTKSLEGRTLEDNQFTFELKDASGNVLQTKKNTANGKVTFDSISYTQADVSKSPITYTISEVNDGKAGYKYDTVAATVTVTLSDDGEGHITAKPTYSKNIFKNEYKATGSITFEGTKTLTGRVLTANDVFTFEILEGNKSIGTATNDQTGKITYPTINYTETDVREHTYTIKETSQNTSSVTVDTNTYTVKVNVKDNGDGTLEVTSDDPIKALNFVNTYSASGNVALEADKTLTGRTLEENQFTFELKDATGNVLQTKKNTANGKVTFDTISYTEANMKDSPITYTISEVNDGKAGYKYDTVAATVTVTLSDDGEGHITAKPTYSKNIFKNEYKATGSITFEGTKTLTGRALTANDVFTFEILEGNKSIGTATNDQSGKISYPTINYTEKDVGEHTYTIKETSQNTSSVTVDTKTYTVKVTVTDKGNGTLEATSTDPIKALNFVNTYSASGNVVLEADKALTGRALEDNQFTFELKDAEGKVLQTKKNTANGKVIFDTIRYTEANMKDSPITYTISEVNDKKDGYTYDTEVATITVTLSDDGEGHITATPNYSKTTFENAYEAKGDITFEGTKTLTGREMTEDDVFTFEIVENGTVIATAENDASGKIEYPTIEYVLNKDKSDLGDHEYTVRESSTDGNGITVATNTYTVTVKVEDNGDGTLKVTPSDNYTALDFVNDYEAKGEITFVGTKTIDGREMTENDIYTFEIKEGDDVITTVVNDAEGNIAYPTIEYILNKDESSLGEHTYTITETSNGGYGIIKDTTVYTVTVNVEDDGQGKLVVTPSDNYQELNFVNKYRVIDITVNKTWDDLDNKFGFRPDSITVRLKANGKEVKTARIIGIGNDWKYTFSNLEEYSNGEKIKYTITEDAVPYYTTTIVDNGNNTFKITNKIIPMGGSENEPPTQGGTVILQSANPATRSKDYTLIYDTMIATAIIAIAIVTKNERDRDKRIRILNSTRIKFK